MNQNPKKGKVRGSVLLTVVGVMMVTVVFMMSTLVLTNAAKRRSYYTYFETQAQYAAQAALDAVSNAAYHDADFYDFIQTVDDTTIGMELEDLPQITVNFNDSNLHLSDGDVTCYAQYVGSYYVWNDDVNRVTTETAWKIIAEAHVGEGRNEAVAQVANYLYGREASRTPDTIVSGTPNSAQFWVTNAFNASSSTTGGGGPTVITGRKEAIQSFSGLSGANNQGTNMGGSSYGISTFPAGRKKYETLGTVGVDGSASIPTASLNNALRNNGTVVGNSTFVGNTGQSGANGQNKFMFQTPSEGIAIYGDLWSEQSEGISIWADLDPTKQPINYYYEVPYVYVDGTIFVKPQKGYTMGTKGNTPLNVFAGNLVCANDAGNKLDINGDLYLMDPELDSNFRVDSVTNLTEFVRNNVKREYSAEKGYTAGDIICNNKTFVINTKDPATYNGDIIMTNPDSTLHILSGTTVKGSIVCAGKLVLQKDITVQGGIYMDPAKATLNGHTINGKATLREACEACVDVTGTDANGNQVTYKNSVASARIEALGFTQNARETWDDGTALTPDEKYSNLVSGILTKHHYYPNDYVTKLTGYGIQATHDFGLYPFAMRYDEIHKGYTRWDLPFDSQDAVVQYLNNTAGNLDNLIKESISCGHNWSAIEQQSAAGSKWFPHTTPVDPNNAHAFIADLKTVKPTSAATYYDSLDALKAAYPSATLEPYVQPQNKTQVKIVCHDNDGKIVDDSKECYVITDSCELDLSLGNNGNPILFIDPYAGGHTDENPLVIAIKGQGAQATVVVNNTAIYSGTDYQNYTLIKDTNKVMAGRGEVILFFENSVGGVNKWGVMSSGAYKMYSGGGDFGVIGNPIYPIDPRWNALKDEADKYKYELVPNIKIYAAAGTLNSGTQGPFLNANVMAPTTNFGWGDSSQLSIPYREYTECKPYKSSEATYVVSVGTFSVADFKSTNLPGVFYIGDNQRPSSWSSTVTTYTGNQNDQTQQANKNQITDDGDIYLSNDHRAAG